MHKKTKDRPLTKENKRSIGKVVKKVVLEYGEVLKKLGENRED